jgi:hypothetical protein
MCVEGKGYCQFKGVGYKRIKLITCDHPGEEIMGEFEGVAHRRTLQM